MQDKYSRHLSKAGNTICPSRNNINDRCIFGQDDKTKHDIDKTSNKDLILVFLGSSGKFRAEIARVAWIRSLKKFSGGLPGGGEMYPVGID